MQSHRIHDDCPQAQDGQELTARQVDRLRLLNELSRALAATLDLDEMIEISLHWLAAALNAPMGAAFAISPPMDANVKQIYTLSRGWIEMDIPASARQYQRAFVKQIQEGDIPSFGGDELARLVGTDSGDLAERWGPHGLLVPVFREGTLAVALTLGGRQEPFTDEEQSLMQAAAVYTAQFIQNGWQHQALVKAEARYRELYEGVSAGLYRTTPEGRFVAVNRALVQMLGFPDEETLLATPATELYVAADGRRTWQDHVAKGSLHDFEIQARRYDGRILWLHDTGRAVYGEDGQVLYYEGSIINVTARKQAELALQEAERRYRTVSDFTYDWEYWEAPDGEWLYVSPSCERITGYPPEQFMANPHLLDELIVPEDRETWKSHHHADRAQEPQQVMFRIRGRCGEIRWIEHWCQPVVDESGAFLGYRASNRDATERMQIEAQRNATLQALRESEERLRTLINATPDLICFKDGKGRWLLANEASLQILGLENVDYRGKTDSELAELSALYRHIALTCEDRDGEVWEKGRISRSDGVISLPDGSTKTYDVIKVPLFYPDGQRRALVTLGRDITEYKLAEDELRRSEATLAEAQRIARMASWEWDLESNELWSSRQGYQLFGLTPQTSRASFDDFIKVVHPDDRGLVVQAIDQALHKGRPYDIEHRILLPDGEERVVHGQAEVFFDASGRPQRMMGMLRDITERVRLEERLSAVHRLGQELTLIHDEEAIISRTLAVAVQVLRCRYAGYGEVDEAAGTLHYRQRLIDSILGASDTRLPLDGDKGVGVAVARSGQAINIPDTRQEPRYTCPGGQANRFELCVPMKVKNRVIGVLNAERSRHGPFTSADEQLLQTLANQAAVALENARLYAASRVHAEKLAALNEIGLTLTASLDQTTVINKALEQIQRLFHAQGALFLQIGPQGEIQFARALCENDSIQVPHDSAPWKEVALRIMKEGQPVIVSDIEADAYGSDQMCRQLGNHTRTLMAVPFQPGGHVSGILEVTSDEPAAWDDDDLRALQSIVSALTVALENARFYEEQRALLRERERIQAQLIHSEKMSALGRLVASLAHEINNPLQAVQSCLTLAEEELEEQGRREKVDSYLDIAGSEIERIAAIVRRMRDFYRPPREEMVPLDLHDVLNNVLSLSYKQLQHSNVTVIREWAQDLPLIIANPDYLKQVFLNLVLNAMDAMPNGGTLQICTAPAQLPGESGELSRPAVRITFSDNGVGMSPEMQDRIFEPFFTTKERGSGLGLSISYRLIKAHGGQISAQSQEGKGTIFTILLPQDGNLQ